MFAMHGLTSLRPSSLTTPLTAKLDSDKSSLPLFDVGLPTTHLDKRRAMN